MANENDTRTFVNSYTSNGGTSNRLRKARRWNLRDEMPCPFCKAWATRGSWMQHIIAKHAPQGAGQSPWLKAFNFGEIEWARNCTNGATRTVEAA